MEIPGSVPVTVAVRAEEVGSSADVDCQKGAAGDGRKGRRRREQFVAGSIRGIFHPDLYLASRNCITYMGEVVGRSKFERLGNSTMAKWYRSIRVIDDDGSLEPLGQWLSRHGLPVHRGKQRRSAHSRHRAGRGRGGAGGGGGSVQHTRRPTVAERMRGAAGVTLTAAGAPGGGEAYSSDEDEDEEGEEGEEEDEEEQAARGSFPGRGVGAGMEGVDGSYLHFPAADGAAGFAHEYWAVNGCDAGTLEEGSGAEEQLRNLLAWSGGGWAGDAETVEAAMYGTLPAATPDPGNAGGGDAPGNIVPLGSATGGAGVSPDSANAGTPGSGGGCGLDAPPAPFSSAAAAAAAANSEPNPVLAVYDMWTTGRGPAGRDAVGIGSGGCGADPPLQQSQQLAGPQGQGQGQGALLRDTWSEPVPLRRGQSGGGAGPAPPLHLTISGARCSAGGSSGPSLLPALPLDGTHLAPAPAAGCGGQQQWCPPGQCSAAGRDAQPHATREGAGMADPQPGGYVGSNSGLPPGGRSLPQCLSMPSLSPASSPRSWSPHQPSPFAAPHMSLLLQARHPQPPPAAVPRGSGGGGYPAGAFGRGPEPDSPVGSNPPPWFEASGPMPPAAASGRVSASNCLQHPGPASGMDPTPSPLSPALLTGGGTGAGAAATAAGGAEGNSHMDAGASGAGGATAAFARQSAPQLGRCWSNVELYDGSSPRGDAPYETRPFARHHHATPLQRRPPTPECDAAYEEADGEGERGGEWVRGRHPGLLTSSASYSCLPLTDGQHGREPAPATPPGRVAAAPPPMPYSAPPRMGPPPSGAAFRAHGAPPPPHMPHPHMADAARALGRPLPTRLRVRPGVPLVAPDATVSEGASPVGSPGAVRRLMPRGYPPHYSPYPQPYAPHHPSHRTAPVPQPYAASRPPVRRMLSLPTERVAPPAPLPVSRFGPAHPLPPPAVRRPGVAWRPLPVRIPVSGLRPRHGGDPDVGMADTEADAQWEAREDLHSPPSFRPGSAPGRLRAPSLAAPADPRHGYNVHEAGGPDDMSVDFPPPDRHPHPHLPYASRSSEDGVPPGHALGSPAWAGPRRPPAQPPPHQQQQQRYPPQQPRPEAPWQPRQVQQGPPRSALDMHPEAAVQPPQPLPQPGWAGGAAYARGVSEGSSGSGTHPYSRQIYSALPTAAYGGGSGNGNAAASAASQRAVREAAAAGAGYSAGPGSGARGMGHAAPPLPQQQPWFSAWPAASPGQGGGGGGVQPSMPTIREGSGGGELTCMADME